MRRRNDGVCYICHCPISENDNVIEASKRFNVLLCQVDARDILYEKWNKLRELNELESTLKLQERIKGVVRFTQYHGGFDELL